MPRCCVTHHQLRIFWLSFNNTTFSWYQSAFPVSAPTTKFQFYPQQPIAQAVLSQSECSIKTFWSELKISTFFEVVEPKIIIDVRKFHLNYALKNVSALVCKCAVGLIEQPCSGAVVPPRVSEGASPLNPIREGQSLGVRSGVGGLSEASS